MEGGKCTQRVSWKLIILALPSFTRNVRLCRERVSVRSWFISRRSAHSLSVLATRSAPRGKRHRQYRRTRVHAHASSRPDGGDRSSVKLRCEIRAWFSLAICSFPVRREIYSVFRRTGPRRGVFPARRWHNNIARTCCCITTVFAWRT